MNRLVKDGAELENLVAAIEQALAPAGVNVELGYRVFRDDGQQLAEFDIVIRGGVGSSSIDWLIECRDRPSQGPAPGSWIEQLIGRRGRFRFDKVFAVSTTGFARGARELARDEGIVVRSVSSADQIADDLDVFEFRLKVPTVEMRGYIDCDFVDPSSEQPDLVKQITQEESKVKGIRIQGESDFWTPAQFITSHLDKSGEMPNPDDDEDYDLVFDYDGEVDLLYEGDRILPVRNLSVPYRLRITHFTTTTVSGAVYTEEGRSLGQELAFKYEIPDGSVRYSALILRKPDGDVDIKQHRDIEFTPATSPDA